MHKFVFWSLVLTLPPLLLASLWELKTYLMSRWASKVGGPSKLARRD
jgi:hypothetical protein